eukprot:4783270-Pleurochrysis_carterae.AAC.7
MRACVRACVRACASVRASVRVLEEGNTAAVCRLLLNLRAVPLDGHRQRHALLLKLLAFARLTERRKRQISNGLDLRSTRVGIRTLIAASRISIMQHRRKSCFLKRRRWRRAFKERCQTDSDQILHILKDAGYHELEWLISQRENTDKCVRTCCFCAFQAGCAGKRSDETDGSRDTAPLRGCAGAGATASATAQLCGRGARGLRARCRACRWCRAVAPPPSPNSGNTQGDAPR